MATKSEIIVDSNNTYVPNTSGLITPQLVQTLNTNWINSSIFPEQTGSMSVASASLATSASFATNAATASLLLGAVVSSSYAYTASSAVNATNALTASFVSGTVASASLAANSLLLQGTGSNGFATTASLTAVSSSGQQVSASYIALSASYNVFSGSASTRITNTSQSLQAVSASTQQVSASYIALSASYNVFSGSASARITAVSSSDQQTSASYVALSGSYNVFSGSASTRITNNATNIQTLTSATASYAVLANNQTFTGKNTFNNDVTASNVRITGTASIAFLDVQFQSSSVIYSSGSNQFGDASNDTQTLWGTVNVISGPLVVTGSANFKETITGSISGNAATATSSTSASFASTANFANNAESAVSASIAQFAGIASAALTASYAYTASSAEKSFEAVSSSYALTASFALNAGSAFPFTGSAQISGSLTITGSIRQFVASGSKTTNISAVTNSFVGNTEIIGSGNGASALIVSGSGTFRNSLTVRNNLTLGNQSSVSNSTITVDSTTKSSLNLNTFGTTVTSSFTMTATENSAETGSSLIIDSTLQNLKFSDLDNTTTFKSTFLTINSYDSGSGSIPTFNRGLAVTGSLNAQAISSSFSGSGAQIFGVVSSSYALTASFALNAAGGAAFPYTGSAQITGSLGVTGSTSIIGSTSVTGILSSTDRYLLGGDLSLIPITSNQAVITSWWGMQLVGNKQSSVNYSPSPIGANDDFSVIVPTQQANKIGLIVKGQTNQTGNLLELRDINNNGWSAFSNSGSLSLGKTTPSARLDVLGNTIVTGSAEISGSLSVTGSVNVYNNVIGSEFYANTAVYTNTIYDRSVGTVTISPANGTIFTTLLDAKAKITVTGSLLSQPVSQSVSSLTASLDLTSGNFFNLTLPASVNTYITASGQVPGQTVNLKITQQATTGSVSFGAGIKQVSGSAYVATAAASAVDIVTFISFDNTGLYVSNVKNLI